VVKIKASKAKKVSVTKGKDKEVTKEVNIPTTDVAEIQDGVQPKKRPVEQTPEGYATIAYGLGATINMGDFQSARIDVFIQRNVKDDDAVIQDEFKNISELLQTEIERQSAILMGDED
jgi:hypothetical protein